MKSKVFLGCFYLLLCQPCLANNYFNQNLSYAERGFPEAQYNLGIMYENGEYVELDYKKAYFWYLKAANQGDVKSQYAVGTLFDYGDGVKQDYNQAVNWYEIAATNGCANAQYAVGFAFEKGEGRKKNFSEAIKWYKKSAQQGDPSSMRALSRIYTKGLGVKPNTNTAKEWLNKSVVQELKNKKINKDLCVEDQAVTNRRIESIKVKQKDSDPTDYSLTRLKDYVNTYLYNFYDLQTFKIKVDREIEEKNDNLFWTNEEHRQYQQKISNYEENRDSSPKVIAEHATLHGQTINLAITFSIDLTVLDKNGKPKFANNLHPSVYTYGRLLFKDGQKCKNYALRAEQYLYEVLNFFPDLTLKSVSVKCYDTF
ncbi:MAG: tetratricopeptide repeat protein [Bacilli bacterium]